MKSLKSCILRDICETTNSKVKVEDNPPPVSDKELKSLLSNIIMSNFEGISDGNKALIASTVRLSLYKEKLYEWLYKSWTGKDYATNSEFSSYDKIVAKDVSAIISRSDKFNVAMQKLINQWIDEKYEYKFNITGTNIYKQLPSILTPFEKELKQFRDIKQSRNTGTVGRWEILLQTFFTNITSPKDGHGDCIVNGRITEIKGNDGRVTALKPMGESGVTSLKAMLKVINNKDIDSVLTKGQLFASSTYKSQRDVLNILSNDVLTSSLTMFFTEFTGSDKLDEWIDSMINIMVGDIKGNSSSLNLNLVFNSMISAINLKHYAKEDNFEDIIFINNESGNYLTIQSVRNKKLEELYDIFIEQKNKFSYSKFTTDKKDSRGAANYGPAITYNG